MNFYEDLLVLIRWSVSKYRKNIIDIFYCIYKTIHPQKSMITIIRYILSTAIILVVCIGALANIHQSEQGSKMFLPMHDQRATVKKVAYENPAAEIDKTYSAVSESMQIFPEGYFTDIEFEEKVVKDISQFDFDVRNDLGFPRIQNILNSYEETIKEYANRYSFDWRLILAVMNQESRFQIQAVSHRGAYGLMQIMPMTGRDVSMALGIDGVRQPKDNIAGGVYYLWRVRSLFDVPTDITAADLHPDDDDIIRLSLAAYNAGPTRVRDAQQLAIYLGLNPYRWQVIKDLLPMLSRRYYTLHQYVWENGRPEGGYFHGWPETMNYVDNVMGYYAYYRLIFE